MTRQEAMALLQAAGVADALRDVRRLERFADGDHARFEAAVRARAERRPLSHITGRRAFWTHEFLVTPDVLDPRPETETLIECALKHPFERFLDLGTGSGAIAVSLLAERPGARGVASDVSEQAVLVAGENALRAGVIDRLILPLSDWYADLGGRYDLIVSNPPYIALAEMADLTPEVREHEPRGALTDEGDGLSAYRAIARGAPDHLTPGGRLIVEIGPRQAEDVTAIFAAAGLVDIACHRDLDGRDRVVEARAPSA
ncbi:MAG: peptide chain release factor N(5)-glutamine methyltransferase [Silicimonas sp.]|nr:peptide chain release factor N(5)-glutamine methyltransferase [Silicimonas sp.]